MTKRNYTTQLARLKDRRQGAGLKKSAALESLASTGNESYESRTPKDSLKYALGAMQAVSADYTRISHEEGDRVAKQLLQGHQALGTAIETKLQGSLPLNIHLRRYSDVDLLVLPTSFVQFDPMGFKATSYTPSSIKPLDKARALRTNSHAILVHGFPQVTVDQKSKCLSLSGGSLARKIDVVPALWYDCAEYQTTGAARDRGVHILDVTENTLQGNFPFRYQAEINAKDTATSGGAKKAIRLLKTLKYDADQEITLSSFDIASLVWNMPEASLNFLGYLDLAIVAETLGYLLGLCADRARANTLNVADGTRKIIQSDTDFQGLHRLTRELADLTESIAAEVNPIHALNLDTARREVRKYAVAEI